MYTASKYVFFNTKYSNVYSNCLREALNTATALNTKYCYGMSYKLIARVSK